MTSISITPDSLPRREAYHVLARAIAPRPIAWVSTISVDGILNLAPYSFFSAVSSHPPIIMISVGMPRSGRVKDTLTNIRATGEFVVNIVDEALAGAMHQTSADYPPVVDEFEAAGLQTAPSINVVPPRVANAPVALETALHQLITIDGSQDTIILGRVLRYHIRRDVLDESGAIDPRKLRPVGEISGGEYGCLGEVIHFDRATPPSPGEPTVSA
ncbi:MAG: flavin reductase family protein [Anaerolineae bacterium]|nr:flavin reductase family protein [Anaerolineae bacterium]